MERYCQNPVFELFCTIWWHKRIVERLFLPSHKSIVSLGGRNYEKLPKIIVLLNLCMLARKSCTPVMLT